MKTEKILIRVEPEIKKKIDKKAGSIGLSVSSYMRMLAIKDMEGGGK